jgi:urea transport system ATP-binding protein
MDALLTVSALSQSYGQSRTLWDVDLNLAAGEALCLIGRNGVGKTTLLSCLMGLVPASSGAVSFNGVDLTSLPPEARAPLGIGYVPQGRMIFPLLTVEENLRVGLTARRGRREGVLERVFELFPVLESMLSRRGGDLSGGQQQQLAIGRALVLEPKLLILDEPTEGIQPSIIKEIGAVIRMLVTERKMAVLLVEQYYDFAERLADSYAVMSRGQITHRGSGARMKEDNVSGLLAL